jgi:hypothetical protein
VTTGADPEINTLVDLRLDDGRDFPSRIEDTAVAVWTLAAPFGGGVEPPETGSSMQVRWTSQRGQYIAPVRLLAVTRGAVTCWTVELNGPVQLDQRRRYVRAGGGEPVTVRPAEPADAKVAIGRIVDISEGSVRCWLSPAEIGTGQEVHVTVNLDNERLTIPGTVLKAVERNGGKELDLVVTFTLGEELAGLVRRYVMRAQLQARRAAADVLR